MIRAISPAFVIGVSDRSFGSKFWIKVADQSNASPASGSLSLASSDSVQWFDKRSMASDRRAFGGPDAHIGIFEFEHTVIWPIGSVRFATLDRGWKSFELCII